MLRSIIKLLGYIIAIAAFFFIYGTAGASDLNRISAEQVVIRLIAGMVALIIGAVMAARKEDKHVTGCNG